MNLLFQAINKLFESQTGSKKIFEFTVKVDYNWKSKIQYERKIY